ncbi:MAG: SAM-dependent chlorinase/fluorinase [Candidatus Bathyarchaeia archaeon]
MFPLSMEAKQGLMRHPIITLTTDFGLKDPYVAEIKAVILGISPNTTIVDITHNVEKFNVRMGAYILACASQYFPKGTIHVAVVDPNVGTERRAVLVQTEHAFYIGPDNGVLALTLKNQKIKHVYEIKNKQFMMPKISNTFHGRDVFAPVAAHLANGTPSEKFGPEIGEIVTPRFARVVRRRDVLVGEVLHVDDFGNVITNFGEKELKRVDVKDAVEVELRNARLRLRFCRFYAEVEPQKPLALIGSHNFLEIAVNQGDAAENFKIKAGDKVKLYRS